MNIKLYSIKTQKLTEKGINNQENKQTNILTKYRARHNRKYPH